MRPASNTLRIGGGGGTVSSWIGRHIGGITSDVGLLLGETPPQLGRNLRGNIA